MNKPKLNIMNDNHIVQQYYQDEAKILPDRMENLPKEESFKRVPKKFIPLEGEGGLLEIVKYILNQCHSDEDTYEKGYNQMCTACLDILHKYRKSQITEGQENG